MTAIYLWEFGSLILVILGTLHLLYTFFSNKFSSKNENLISEMKNSHIILTKKVTMWRGWIGFNASHSSGIMFIGIINFYVALEYFTVFESDHLYFIFNILTIGFYVWLAKKYWFKIPFTGILTTLICYTLSYIIILIY